MKYCAIIFAFLLVASLAGISQDAAKAASERPNGVADTRTAGDVYPEAAVGALRFAKLAKMPAVILAKVGDKEIRKDDLQERIARVKTQKEEMFSFVLSEMVGHEILLAEAEKEGLLKDSGPRAEEAAVKELVRATAGEIEITDKELDQAYQEHKSQFGDMPQDKVKEMLKGFLVVRKQMEASASVLDEMIMNTTVLVNEKWVARQNEVLTDNPVDKARKSGKRSVVLFCRARDENSRRMTSVFTELRKVRKDNNFVVAYSQELDFISLRYGVVEVPTVLYFDAHGEVAGRGSGLLSKDEILGKIDDMQGEE